MASAAAPDPGFLDLVDLADERLGSAAIACNDEFFAEKENLVRRAPAVWKEHVYTDRGKWMDGWETRRRRPADGLGPDDHDWCIVRLGVPGIVRGVVIDTAFFRGNYPKEAALEGCLASGHASPAELAAAHWVPLVARTPLDGDSKNVRATQPVCVSHVRLRIYPDGGVARLRVHGDVLPDPARLGGLSGELDLAAVENGAYALAASDMFFGVRHNLIFPGRAVNMSDGWETRRRRGPGHDWVIVRLVGEGEVRRVEVDTNHFKGNAPAACTLEGTTAAADATVAALTAAVWRPLLAETALQPHTRHFLGALPAGPITHVRLNVFPDGGVSRLRLHGALTIDGRRRAGLVRVGAVPDDTLARELTRCLASARWVAAVMASRPWSSPAALHAAADAARADLGEADWLEAFRAHPRIGERHAARPQGATEARWSASEQAGASAADDATRAAIAAGNAAYEQRFGFVYLINATGKSASELRARLEARLGSDRATELATAADEQRQIMHLRLDKLLDSPAP
jgi:allantoicase